MSNDNKESDETLKQLQQEYNECYKKHATMKWSIIGAALSVPVCIKTS